MRKYYGMPRVNRNKLAAGLTTISCYSAITFFTHLVMFIPSRSSNPTPGTRAALRLHVTYLQRVFRSLPDLADAAFRKGCP